MIFVDVSGIATSNFQDFPDRSPDKKVDRNNEQISIRDNFSMYDVYPQQWFYIKNIENYRAFEPLI